MSVSRQDAWTQDEDLILAELVLRHIREGSTQLNAFEEVGKRLSRTTAACGFRWNSYVRKQYTSAIELAKKQRKEGKKQRLKKEPLSSAFEESVEAATVKLAELQLEDVIAFLVSLKDKEANAYALEKQVVDLISENEELRQEVSQLEDKLLMMEEDYLALIEIMNKARKMVIHEENKKNSKVKFQMDKNGNLERMK